MTFLNGVLKTLKPYKSGNCARGRIFEHMRNKIFENWMPQLRIEI